MSIQDQIFIILAMFAIGLYFIRGFLDGIIYYQLNRKAYKKRKEGQSLKEAILYSRFKQEIPNVLLILYYFIIFIHIAAATVCIIISILDRYQTIGDFIPRFIYYFDGLWVIVIHLMFWSPKPGIPYERWISKRRGMKNKKK